MPFMRHDLIRAWLRLPAEPWPPDPHTLLGLAPDITDSGTIEEHARERMQRVRAYQLAHPDEAAEAMRRLAQALVHLTDPEGRRSLESARLPPSASPVEEAAEPESDVQGEESPSWPDEDDEAQTRRTRRRMRRSMLWVGILVVVVFATLAGGILAYRTGMLDRLWTTGATTAPTESVHEVRRITGFSGAITCVAYAPDGGRFVCGGDDHLPRLWDARTGKEIRKFTGHTGNVCCAVFSSDGKKLLTGGEDKTARLWDVELGVELVHFDGHEGPVTGVAFAADGRRAYSCAKDNTLREWDMERGQELRRTSGRLGVYAIVAFSTDGRQVLSAEGERVRLDDVEGKRDPRLFPACGARVTSVALSRDGRKALAGDEVGGLHLWDVESGKELGRWAGHKGAVTSVALSLDGNRALSGGGDQTLRVWQVGE
jgi:hypothetical protein